MRFFKAIIPVVAALSATFTSVVAKPVHAPSSGELEVRATNLTYPDILASAQSRVATLTPQIQKLIPFGNDTTQIDVAAVQNVLQQVNSVVVTATSQVKLLVGQPDDQIRGGKDDNTLYYATQDFVISIGKTIAPAAAVGEKVPEIQSSLGTINQSLTNFNNTVAACFIWIWVLGLGLIGLGAVLTAWGEQLLK
ncbi:hypothetical protein M407DRAFT_223436 [Tulasnella calospora MUT 4182]|uniref:Uncharacterized protein n=1 Tax=Tulasnella calospora MUT 4182 TaxID=1051891 RepID=A0A0C3PW58_9AGAM|nr:hypothetical protein M407DRAFT_223436 [Tulasnella calospora MUT 4182]